MDKQQIQKMIDIAEKKLPDGPAMILSWMLPWAWVIILGNELLNTKDMIEELQKEITCENYEDDYK